VMTSQVHRSAAAGSRVLGAVHPRTCLNSRKVCSRSKRRKNACHHLSTSSGVAPVAEDHSHTAWGHGRRAGAPPAAGSGCLRGRAARPVVQPGGAVGEPGMQPVPGLRHGGAIPGGHRRRGNRRAGPAGRIRESEFPAMAAGPARVPGCRSGTGKCSTRSDRSRPRTSTGRSASR
jgi:hypothetical protein